MNYNCTDSRIIENTDTKKMKFLMEDSYLIIIARNSTYCHKLRQLRIQGNWSHHSKNAKSICTLWGKCEDLAHWSSRFVKIVFRFFCQAQPQLKPQLGWVGYNLSFSSHTTTHPEKSKTASNNMTYKIKVVSTNE